MKTKAIILIIIFAVAILILQVGRQEGRRASKQLVEGREAPLYKLAASADGKVVSAEDYRGRAVIVNFWASWCASCVAEMPSFQKFYEANKSNTSLVVITVLYKDDINDALKFMKENKYDLPVFLDDKSTNARAFGLTGVPETFFIDKHGVLFKKVLGPIEWESPDLKELVKELLSKA
ncbi:TlpA family protein disulfide reductase [Candidatus Magnetominusculus dajiuhuensis]|uniref:TlpA family protein disulfide reductase n=1 Tax=Candidatus Magnetominusculus dajiuhuensis TaxID=3137712 RepID=UPI003B4283E2